MENKKQTAMQALIDLLKVKDAYKECMPYIIDIIEEVYIPMEKKQIQDAFYDGYYQEELYDSRKYYLDHYGIRTIKNENSTTMKHMENKQTAMTPKEKAEELFRKMYEIRSSSASDITKHFAKQSALIAVDEIIANIEPSVSMDVISSRIKYWQEVKQEIEKL